MDIKMIDISIVIGYLLLTLIIGIYKGRDVKDSKDFAIGDYKFSDSALMATITATWIGAFTTIGPISKTYQYGLIWLIVFLGDAWEILVFKLLAPRAMRFKGCISVSEIINLCYGRIARAISAISIAMTGIGAITAQITAIGLLFNMFFGISPLIGLLIGSLIIIIYSSFGGIKAVTATDMIQFAFFMVAMPVIANLVLVKAGGYKEIVQSLPNEYFEIFPNNISIGEFITLFLFFITPFFNPDVIQRILMAKDKKQISNSFKFSALVMILFFCLCGVIGFSLRKIDPNLEPDNVLYYTMMNYLPVGIKGLCISGLLAIIMSTIDSTLNSVSVNVIHDLVLPLSKTALSSKKELLITRLTSLLIGLSGIIISTRFYNIVDILLNTWSMWAGIMVVPLASALFGIKSNSRVFLITAIISSLSMFLWWLLEIEEKTGLGIILPAISISSLTFIFTTLYYHKFAPEKLCLPKLPAESDYQEEEEKEVSNIANKIKNSLSCLQKNYTKYLPTINNLLRFSNSRIHYYGAQYMMFAYFAIASLVFPYFMWSEANNITIFGQEISILLRFIGAALAFVLGISDIMPDKHRKYLPLYWHITLMYCLPFMTTFLFLYNDGTEQWFVNVALSAFLLAVLVDWISFIVLLTLGVFLGYKFFVLLAGADKAMPILNNIGKMHLLFYVCFFSTLIGMLFSRSKEYIQKKVVALLDEKVKQRTKQLEDALLIKQEFLNNLNHEIRTPVMGVVNFSQILDENWDMLPDNQRRELVRQLHASSDRFYDFINNIFSLSNFTTGNIELNATNVDLKEIIEEVIKFKHNLQPKKDLEVKLNIDTTNTIVKVDKFKIMQVVKSLISNALKYTNKGDIVITISEGAKERVDGSIVRGKMVTVTDKGVGVPKDELETIFEPFNQSTRTKTPAGGHGLSLALAKKIINSHLGVIWAYNNQQDGTSFSFIIPDNEISE